MSIDELKEALMSMLTQTFASNEIQADLETGHFVVIKEKYTINIVASKEELSYSLKLNRPINKQIIGLGENYEIPAQASGHEMEDLYRYVQTDVEVLLKNIVDDDIYVGSDGKFAYIGYKDQNKYMLRKFKKSLIFGVTMEEKPADKSILKRLGMKTLLGS